LVVPEKPQISLSELIQRPIEEWKSCVKNVGDVFSPVKLSLKGYFLLLIKPDVHVSTPDAYSLVVPEKPQISLSELIQRPIEEWKSCVKNDFEKSVFAKHPAIRTIKDNLYDMGAVYASMSGSGSSVYGIFDSIPEQNDLFDGCFVAGGMLE